MVRQSVLVVEDEEDIRELVSYNLLKEGYQVAGVAPGEDALTAVESKTPDLVLLDIMLPGLDGLRVCRKLKENPKFESIPIFMLTAKGEEPDIVGGGNVWTVGLARNAERSFALTPGASKISRESIGGQAKA
jgi:two-component system, OmpR family, alkaline phosphatase synthesis response regulator PhoP